MVTKRPIEKPHSATPGAFTKKGTTKSMVLAASSGLHNHFCETCTAFLLLILKVRAGFHSRLS
jgi:hypothetical protein